jgi:hypothetical protein
MAVLKNPSNGVTIRMYRQGHGDCFLLAFPGEQKNQPYYVLIDCGFKPGSQQFLNNGDFQDIVDSIGEATNYKLDLVIVTHEHQDHVNGFWKETDPYFKDFEILESWFAWTEDPSDRLANRLRKSHGDQLLALVQARHELGLSAAPEKETLERIDGLLSLEFGLDRSSDFQTDEMKLALRAGKSVNKEAMKMVKDKSLGHRGVQFLRPGQYKTLPGSGIGAYVMGPPRRESLLIDEDPVGDEGFPSGGGHGLSFTAAVNPDIETTSPFRREYCVESKNAFGHGFFKDMYGDKDIDAKRKGKIADQDSVPDGASWRRIDHDWLSSAENLALKLNTGINNTSLVIAFELPESKKVLLFAGDAQRGNWISWDDKSWTVNNETITTRDLLSRTVLYKVGHHGSHNATLNGTEDDKYPNLSWMAHNEASQEFTAMITAVNKWAMTKNTPPWRHPLPSIKTALVEKTQGRVFQTDSSLTKPDDVSQSAWDKFMSRVKEHDLYFDYRVMDE